MPAELNACMRKIVGVCMRIVQPVSHKQRILENGEVGNARHCTDFDRQVPFSSLAPTGEQMGGAIATIRLVLGSCSN